MTTRTAQADLKDSLSHWRIWTKLALQDIQMRYRRSSLGPFWITLSMSTTICCMGFLYAYLFRVDMHEYFPYLASGIISWGLLSTLVNETPNCLIDSENYVKNINIPFTSFLLQLVLRNLIIFLHNAVVFLPIIILFDVPIRAASLFIFPGILILSINTVLYGAVLSFIGVRYRDFSQIVFSVTQIGFFLTPIIWSKDLLPTRLHGLLEFNPFYQFLNLIRKPMLGELLTFENFLGITALTLVGLLLFYFVVNKYKNRVVFWL